MADDSAITHVLLENLRERLRSRQMRSAIELAVCASYGQATRQLESALAALDEATSLSETTPAASKQVAP